MTNFRNISDEDLLFSKYLVDLHVKVVSESLESDPPRHPRLTQLLVDDLERAREEQKKAAEEIIRRHLENHDLWYNTELEENG